MSLIDCVKKLRTDGVINENQGKDILKKAKRLENIYQLSGNYPDIDIANKASRDALDGMLNDIRFAQYQEALTVTKVMELRRILDADAITENNWKAIGGKKKGYDRAMVGALLRVENDGHTINAQSTVKMFEFIDKFRSKVPGGIDKIRMFGGKNNDLMRDVVKVKHGDQGSAEAKKFSDMLTTTTDYLFNRLQRAGINVHKLENFGVAHRWDGFLLKSKGKQGFVRDAMQRLDRNRMVTPDGTALDDANLTILLENTYNKLTGGRSQELPLDNEFLSAGSSRSLRSASESNRILHFKSGEDWLQMHDIYGMGDIFENTLSEISRTAQRIAIFEMFGPNPTKVFNSLQLEAKVKNQMLIDRGESPSIKTLVGTPQQMWNLLTGTQSDLVNPRFAETFATLRGFQASAHLGTAVFSNLTDQAFAKQALNLWGASYLSHVHTQIGFLKPGNLEHRKLAAQMLLGMEYAYDSISSANRHGDVSSVGALSGLAKRAADFTIRSSGLARLNQASRGSAGLTLNTHIASNAASTWENLNPKIKLGLKQGGIDSSDWDVIRSTTLTTDKGVKYLDMEGILAADEAVSTKITSIFHGFIRQAAPEPDLQARSIVTGGGAARGTLERELTATFLQFKTFPITVVIQTIRNQMFDPRLTSFSSRVGDAVKLTLAASLIGGAVVQIKNIVNGRDFEDPTTLKFYTKSILQGGSFGIAADALQAATETDRGRVAEQLLGPVASMALDVTTGLAGAGSALTDQNYDKIGKDVIRKLNSQTPGKTWYTKLAIERIFYDQMEQLVRPNAYKDWRRYQRSLKKSTGQEFWWKQGEITPDKLPEVAQER